MNKFEELILNNDPHGLKDKILSKTNHLESISNISKLEHLCAFICGKVNKISNAAAIELEKIGDIYKYIPKYKDVHEG